MSHGTVWEAQPAVRVLENQRKKEKKREKGNDSFHHPLSRSDLQTDYILGLLQAVQSLSIHSWRMPWSRYQLRHSVLTV